MIQVLLNTNDATQLQVTAGKGGTNPEVKSPSININVLANQVINNFIWIKNTGSVPLSLSASGIIGTTNVISKTTVIPVSNSWIRVNLSFVALITGLLSYNLFIDSSVAGFKCSVFQVLSLLSNTPIALPSGFSDFSAWTENHSNTVAILQNQARTFDYTRYVEPGSLSITDNLNQPMQCNFSLTNLDDTFIAPALETYVQIYSNQYNKFVFTGFISVDYQRDYVGRNSKTPSTGFQQYRYAITCAGDEYLLAAKAISFLPPFVNMGAGQILSTLANNLTPGFFDTSSKCASGDLIPYQEYDPNKNWTVMAKEFADQFRYRVRILNKVLYYQPYGDQSFPITYDDTLRERSFDPKGLQTSIYNTTLVNDAIIIGDIEAADNHEDYFVGDGFTSNFPLRYTVFDGDTAHLVSQDWTQGGIDTSKWFEQDPTNVITPAGALNVNGGTNNFGETYLYFRTGLDFGRKIVLNHGEIFLVGNCSGAIIGGVYDNATTFAEVNGSGQCECGFDIRPASGSIVTSSISGTAGLQIQPRRLGQLIGTPVITQQNHYYVLKTIINGKSVNRYTSTFKSLTGAIIQGGTNTATADITWVITDINLNNTNPNMPGFVNTQPPYTDTRFTLRNAVMPAFGIYCLLNIKNANFTLQWTDLFDPPQGSLSAAAISGVSGGQLPVLPGNVGPMYDYELGFGIGKQIATLGNASNISTGGSSSDGTGSELQFYSDSIPGVGSRIKIQAWESQASVARVQDPVSIALEAAVVGDDGHRVAIMTDFKPLPRSSEECELAGKAALMDRTTTIYQGSYTVEDAFFDFKNNDFARTGEFFVINSPQRNLNNYKTVCSSVTTKYIELWTERASISIGFGPTTFLQNLLAMFVPKPNNTLLPQNTAKPPTPIQLANIGSAFCQDLDALTLSGGTVPGLGFNGSNIFVNTGITLGANQFVEVRQNNFGWGLANNDRLAVVSTRTFILPRTRFDATWYFRLLQGTFDGAGNLVAGGLISRRSKIVRVYASIVPSSPTATIDISNPLFPVISVNFAGDIRNIYGVEIRLADNITIASLQAGSSFTPNFGSQNIAQRAFTTPTDLLFTIDNTSTKAVNPTYFIYFFNIMWEYSPSFLITSSINNAFASNAFGAEIISNPGFEIQSLNYGSLLPGLIPNNQLVADSWILSAETTNASDWLGGIDNTATFPRTGQFCGILRLATGKSIINGAIAQAALCYPCDAFFNATNIKATAIPVRGGDIYYFGGYVRWDKNATLPAGVTGLIEFVIVFYDSAGAFISSTPSISLSIPSSIYVYLDGFVSVPAGAAFIIFAATAIVTNSSGGTFNTTTNLYLDARFDDVFIYKANRGTHGTYRPLSNPLTGHDAGATATINIAAFTMRSGGTDLAINSGAIAILAYNTSYYIYYDDAAFAGGSVIFQATTVKEVALLGENRFYVGSIITPAAGSVVDTIGNGDGGSGAQLGMLTIIHSNGAPSTVFQGNGSIANLNACVNPDFVTSTDLTISGAGGIPNTSEILLSGWPSINKRYTSLKVKIVSSIPLNSINVAPTALINFNYFTPTGNPSINIFSGLTLNQTRGLTTDSADIPLGVNLSQATVQVLINTNTGVSGVLRIKVYAIYLEAIE